MLLHVFWRETLNGSMTNRLTSRVSHKSTKTSHLLWLCQENQRRSSVHTTRGVITENLMSKYEEPISKQCKHSTHSWHRFVVHRRKKELRRLRTHRLWGQNLKVINPIWGRRVLALHSPPSGAVHTSEVPRYLDTSDPAEDWEWRAWGGINDLSDILILVFCVVGCPVWIVWANYCSSELNM